MASVDWRFGVHMRYAAKSHIYRRCALSVAKEKIDANTQGAVQPAKKAKVLASSRAGEVRRKAPDKRKGGASKTDSKSKVTKVKTESRESKAKADAVFVPADCPWKIDDKVETKWNSKGRKAIWYDGLFKGCQLEPRSHKIVYLVLCEDPDTHKLERLPVACKLQDIYRRGTHNRDITTSPKKVTSKPKVETVDGLELELRDNHEKYKYVQVRQKQQHYDLYWVYALPPEFDLLPTYSQTNYYRWDNEKKSSEKANGRPSSEIDAAKSRAMHIAHLKELKKLEQLQNTNQESEDDDGYDSNTSNRSIVY